MDEADLSNPFDLSNYQNAAIATSTPNPSVPNAQSSSTLSDFTQLANVAGQWGTTIASLVSGRSPTIAPTGQSVGLIRPTANPNMTMLLLAAAAVAVVVLLRK